MPVDEFNNDYDAGRPWRRKLDDPELPPVVLAADRHYYPTAPDARMDLIEIVQSAESKILVEKIDPNPAAEVRACGSHWALSDIALTQGFVVETNRPVALPGDPARPPMNRTLYDVVPRSLTSEALRFFIGQQGAAFDPTKLQDHSKFYLYHVEAGIRVCELYCRLDAGDHNDDSLAKLLHSQNKPDYIGPWAMPTLGGAGGQTIVGAFSTGTHGGDIHLPPIADAVQAVHLIGAGGKQWWIERELVPGVWLTDPDKLKIHYGKIQLERDADLLNAVIIAAGRMGIIYSVVLRVVRQYALEELRVEDTWEGVKTWINDPLKPNFVNNRFLQTVVNPNRKSDSKEHSAFTTIRNLKPLDLAGTPEPFGRAERCGQNVGNSVPLLSDPTGFFNSICATDSPVWAAIDKLIDDAQSAQEDLEIAVVVALFLGDASAAAIATTAIIALQVLIDFLDDLKSVVPPGPLGKTVALIGQWAVETDNMEIYRLIADLVIRNEHNLDDKNPVTAISYALMDIHNYKDIGCSTSGDSIEVFFDVSSVVGGNRLVAFIDLLIQRVDELTNGTMPLLGGGLSGAKMIFPGYASLRFMSQSAALLAMQKFSRVCAIEIAAFRAAPGTEPLMARIGQDAFDMGATIHWGQRHRLNMKQVEATFGDFWPADPLPRWRKALSRLSNNGRFPTFSTQFTRDRGLEIIEPQIDGFTVLPTDGCAGAPVRVEWSADNNPPGTTARLEVVTPTSSTPLSVIPLDTLDGPWDTLTGAADIPLPAGRREFKLVVERVLNGRPVGVNRTVSVRGFQPHDIWSFVLGAYCMPVDGLGRWGVRISLANSVSPSLKVEELQCAFSVAGVTTPGGWRVRRSGIPDIAFAPASTVQILPTPATLQGEWIFFVESPGCAGTPPELHAQFTITC